MNDKKIFKNRIERSIWSETGVYIDCISIQEDSTIIQTHPSTLNPPNKAKNQGICDCS